MLLVVDIGNTNVVFGCFRGDELVFELRLKTDPGRTSDEYVALLETLFSRKLGKSFRISGCVVSSVVPPVTTDIVALVRDMIKVEPLVVGPGIKTGISIKVQEPAAVGSDRVTNALAVRELFGAPAIVIDFGTATSFDVVSADGNYEGGAIVPGIEVSLDSLVMRTAKLPKIELTWPRSAIGKSTVSAMQVGSVLGYMCLVEGLIDKISAELGAVKHVVATGGLGRLFAEHSNKISAYDPHLTLKGLKLIAALNGVLA